MNQNSSAKNFPPVPAVELLTQLNASDLNDLCDATDAAIKAGGGFGWIDLPAREVMERFWQGVVVMPMRLLFVARLDGVICGTCQRVMPAPNNQAQSHAAQLTTHFVSPWARGYGLSEKLLTLVETTATQKNISVINLDVRETMTQAIALYERFGYQRIGHHPNYANIGNQRIGGFYYCKDLSTDI